MDTRTVHSVGPLSPNARLGTRISRSRGNRFPTLLRRRGPGPFGDLVFARTSRPQYLSRRSRAQHPHTQATLSIQVASGDARPDRHSSPSGHPPILPGGGPLAHTITARPEGRGGMSRRSWNTVPVDRLLDDRGMAPAIQELDLPPRSSRLPRTATSAVDAAPVQPQDPAKVNADRAPARSSSSSCAPPLAAFPSHSSRLRQPQDERTPFGPRRDHTRPRVILMTPRPTSVVDRRLHQPSSSMDRVTASHACKRWPRAMRRAECAPRSWPARKGRGPRPPDFDFSPFAAPAGHPSFPGTAHARQRNGGAEASCRSVLQPCHPLQIYPLQASACCARRGVPTPFNTPLRSYPAISDRPDIEGVS